MYNATTVINCLKSTVTLADAMIYAPTYLTMDNIVLAAPKNTFYEDYSASILSGSITKMMGDVIRLKKLTNDVKSVIDEFALYEGRADFNNKNANRGRFVGFEIQMKANSDLAIKIGRLSFQLDMPVQDLPIYLYNSESIEPIKVIPINYTSSRSVQWFDVDITLDDGDGVYYLGYYEADLGQAQSINKGTNLSEPPCSNCSGMEVNRKYYLSRQKYLSIKPIYVNNPKGNGLPDIDEQITVGSNNWGMNFKASVSCDISSFICRNKDNLFYSCLSMRYALDLLEYMLHSTRDNGLVDKIKTGVLFLRDGDAENKTPGLSKKYEDAVQALNIDLSGFNGACLPCVQNWSSRKSYIG